MRGLLILTISVAMCNTCEFVAAEPPGSGKEALSGPKVDMAAKKTSLVERDFDGKLRRLEISPEEAAIGLLKLDEATKAKVDEAVAARSLLLDVFVRDNLDLLLRFSTAGASNNTQEQGMLLRETYEKAEPIRKHGRLQETVGAVLPPEQKKSFVELVQSYRAALANEEIALAASKPTKDGKKPDRAGAMLKIGFEQFGQDVKRAYERVIAEGQGKLEDFIKTLEMSQAQEEKVRKLTSNFAQAHITTPATQKEKTMLFLDISAALEPSQRAKLLKYVQENK